MSNRTDGAPLLGVDRFLDLGDEHYLYTGAHGPALAGVNETLAWAHRCQSRGPAGRVALFDAEERARASVGRMVGRPASDVSFVGDASTAWNQIATGLEWQPGDNVVLNEFEHASVVYPWLRLKSRGLEVRVVARDENWAIEAAAIEAACDSRTRAIAVSQVGYVTGFRHDTSELASVATRVGVPLFVDASQALGVVPVVADDCAIVVSASYKWLLGPYGVGVVVWNRDRLPDFRPGGVGWRSTTNIFTEDRFERCTVSDDARRFQLGAPSLGGIAALGGAVDELLDLGADSVEAHAQSLAGGAIAAFEELGLEVVTSPDRHRLAGNVTFLHPDGERVAAALAGHHVLVWGGDGRVRASFHVMNGTDAVDALRTALRAVLDEVPATPGSGSARR